MQTALIRRSWFFGILILLAVAIPGAFSVLAFNAYRDAAAALTRNEQLSGEIRRLDEVLTMSARLAATSGEARWIERYNANVAPLDAAISEMTTLGESEEVARLVRATDAANQALIAMETRAFELVRQRHGREAFALLLSDEYARQKAIYADGMNAAMETAHRDFAARTKAAWWSFVIAALLAVAGVAGAFLTWLRLMAKSFDTEERLRAIAARERDAANDANAAKTKFLANISHELRTPLNAIIGYTEMLKEGAEENHRSNDVADHDRVLGAARRLLALINDLLDIRKAEAGKIVLNPRQFAVAMFLEEARQVVAPVVAVNNNRLNVVIENELGFAITDDFRLSQCLLNLLSNAAKFTQNGSISVIAKREQAEDGEWLTLTVADTGRGMSEAQLKTIFKPFVQADLDIYNPLGGTGLGLTITRRLARLLGGDVTAESTPGHGSAFHLRVPIRIATPVAPLTESTTLHAA